MDEKDVPMSGLVVALCFALVIMMVVIASSGNWRCNGRPVAQFEETRHGLIRDPKDLSMKALVNPPENTSCDGVDCGCTAGTTGLTTGTQ